jgi:hypothetical protein
MSLGVPGADRPPNVPGKQPHWAGPNAQAIKALIDESTRKFEQKLETIGVLQIARASGWIEEYRQQVLAVALEVLSMVRK